MFLTVGGNVLPKETKVSLGTTFLSLPTVSSAQLPLKIPGVSRGFGTTYRSRRGQEELVGFVLVVVLVAVIGLVLLGLVFRIDDGPATTRSADIAQFLESTYSVTSTCHLSSPLYPATIGELVQSCAGDKQARCREGVGVCDLANRTLHEVVSSSWGVGENASVEGFELAIEIQANRTRGNAHDSVLMGKVGSCTSGYRAGEHLQPGIRRGTTIVTTLTLCTSS